MIRKLAFLLPLVALFSASYVFSATLQVTRIGGLDLGGKIYKEWWYTGENPTFYGKATANSEVTITADTNSHKATADASGDWSYASALAKGDYKMTFAQGSESVAFTLHLGQVLPQNITSSSEQTNQSTTPSGGTDQIVALTLGLGILLLATYFYVYGDPKRKSVFEAHIIKED